MPKYWVPIIHITLLSLCVAGTAVADDTLPAGLLPQHSLSTLDGLQVQGFRFEGNTVFSTRELAGLLDDLAGRSITINDLHQATARITRHYQESGYVTSGAILPDQDVQDGVVLIQVVEGSVGEMQVRGNQYLGDAWLEQRLSTTAPLYMPQLRQRIQLLQNRPPIRRLNVRVSPGAERGEDVLQVDVEEARPLEVRLDLDNRRSPSVGSRRVQLAGTWHSPMGWGDRLSASHSFNQGPDDYAIEYSIPLTADDLSLALSVEQSAAQVLESPFNALGMRSELGRYELALHYPLRRSDGTEIMLSGSLEHRHAKTFLLGFPFSYAAGVEDGVSRVTNLHLTQQWTRRTGESVLALRSDFRFGVRLMNATLHDDLPDGRYSAWLGQVQWLRKLPWANSRVAAKVYLQRTDDALLPSEKFSIGGMDTVRGYRESLLSRDDVLVASLEWWLPLGEWKIPRLSDAPGAGRIELALFADYGRGSNKFADTPSPASIASVGVGLSWQPSSQLSGTLFWGHPLRRVDRPGHWDLQDEGIHFKISMQVL